MKFQLLKGIESAPPDPDDPELGPVHFIGDGAAYFKGTTLTWVTLWAYADDGQLNLELLCDGPHPDHWLGFELDQVGLADLLDLSGRHYEEHGAAIERFLLENGIAPMQPFMIELSYWSGWHDTIDYGREYDSEVDWRLLSVSPQTPGESAKAWEDYLRAKAGWELRDLVGEMVDYLKKDHPIDRLSDSKKRSAARVLFKRSWAEDALDALRMARRWMP